MLCMRKEGRLTKMQSTIEVLSVMDTHKDRAYLFGEVLDVKYKVNR